MKKKTNTEGLPFEPDHTESLPLRTALLAPRVLIVGGLTLHILYQVINTVTHYISTYIRSFGTYLQQYYTTRYFMQTKKIK